jgi:regulator of protease activity HflC (stomatin/prohibitin superfamily)
LKSTNLNGEKLKVNDKSGSPIEIAIIIVWKVKDTAKALFGVEDYNYYVRVQSEAAVRNLAYSYNYNKKVDNEVSLRDGHDQISIHLIHQLNIRFAKAGIEVEEAKVTHLAYAPEIASSMLRSQQAEATIAAREKIIQGAVGIVHQTINTLQENNICELTQDQKAKLVTNLLTILCSDTHVQPVLNTGS